MSGVEVSQLFATLGLRVDKGAWSRADNMIDGVQSKLSSLSKLAVGALAGFSIGSAIKSGLQFNATLEDTRTQIAGMLSLAKHTDLADQFESADGLMKDLQERAKKLPGSMTDYTKVLGMIAQPITDAGIGLKDLEDITVGTAVAAKAMSIDLEAGARDVNQAIMGQFHATDQLTGRILGSLGYIGEEGRKRFNELSKARRAAVLKEALTQKQLAQLADAQSKNASGRWDTFKAQVQETLGRVAAPLFQKLSALLERVNGWLEKNGDTIEKVASVLGGALGVALDALVATFEFLTNGSDEAHAVLLGIAAAIATIVIPILLSMAAAWIIALAPILLIVAAVALVALGILKLIKHWDKVQAAAGRAWDFIRDKIAGAWEWIKDRAIELVDYVVGMPGMILGALKDIGKKIIAAFGDAFDWVVRQAQAALEKVQELADYVPGLAQVKLAGKYAAKGYRYLEGSQTPDIDHTLQAGEAPPATSQGKPDATLNPYNMPYLPGYAPSAPSYTPPAGSTGTTTGGASNVVTTNITVNATEGMDAADVARLAAQKVNEVLDDRLREGDHGR